MCGIAGIFRFDDHPVGQRQLQQLETQIAHRGPDGQGEIIAGSCGLVHSRLSIIDLFTGAQPMSLPADYCFGELNVVFNGEIYNHRALREALEAKGHRFLTDHSDTEVLLHGYREWGDGLPAKLSGMFAFAIYDQRNQVLFLARDRVGKKPLFIFQNPRKIAFGSTIPALRTLVSNLQIDHDALQNFLRYGYTFQNSLIQGIHEITPGSWMRIGYDQKVEHQKYWQPPLVHPDAPEIDLEDAVHERLVRSVVSRLESDVPLGCFLSGGIDSSLIAAIAQQHLSTQGAGKLKTFSVKMPQSDYDESTHAQAVADHIGSDHLALQTRQADVIDDLQFLMSIYGEPTADSSILPQYWLCRETRGYVKVALSGDGGDELFSGYDRYRALQLLRRHRWWLRGMPLGIFDSSKPKSRRHRMGRLIRAARAGKHPAQQYHHIFHLFDEDQIAVLFDRDIEPHAPGIAMPDWPNYMPVMNAAMRWDFEHYLPYETLRKVDRASMSVALEVRSPLLDREIADLVMQIPAKDLMVGGKQKAVLRNIAKRYLPKRIVARPKMGFALPIGQWFRDDLKAVLGERLLESQLPVFGLNKDVLENLYQSHVKGEVDHTHRLFALLQLSLWLDWLSHPS
ncbi:asparagine synthase (glutamine-hydrolyzing) [Poriferisphaera sp. WC338]|uniref:asparagine synthase (glutamine-hydrolyzing) n=1 Tax=Poriferisphaera sp. WC338 TaxID=3425129 RepID=UPI003D81C04D